MRLPHAWVEVGFEGSDRPPIPASA